MCFRLAARLMTLNDLELLCLNFIGISRDFADLRGNNGKTNDDRPVLSVMHRLRRYIAGRSSTRGSTITISWVKMAIFNLYTRKYPAIRKP